MVKLKIHDFPTFENDILRIYLTFHVKMRLAIPNLVQVITFFIFKRKNYIFSFDHFSSFETRFCIKNFYFDFKQKLNKTNKTVVITANKLKKIVPPLVTQTIRFAFHNLIYHCTNVSQMYMFSAHIHV